MTALPPMVMSAQQLKRDNLVQIVTEKDSAHGPEIEPYGLGIPADRLTVIELRLPTGIALLLNFDEGVIYARNLTSGEEIYLAGPRELARLGKR